jgi:hypothetical protein
LEPVSTTLRNIHSSIDATLRALDWNISEQTSVRLHRVEKFLKQAKHFSKKELKTLQIQLYNGEFEDARVTLKDAGMEDSFDEVVDVLAEIAQASKAAGREFGEIPFYYPRAVKDYKQYQEFLSEIHGFDPDGVLSAELKKAEAKHSTLNEFEAAEAINKVLLGVRSGAVSVPGNLKKRVIKHLDQESGRFYHDMNQSLIGYIKRMSEDIETRKLFGRDIDFEKGIADPNATVGGVVAELLKTGAITPAQQEKIYEVFKARLNYRPSSQIVGSARDVGYLLTMGSPISALTQIGDFAWSAVENGHYAGVGLGQAIAGKGLQRKDLHLEQLATELSEENGLRKIVDWTFKAVGLNKIDAIGKEALANSTMARLKKKTKEDIKKEFGKYEPFLKDGIDQLADDIKGGKITHDVRFMMWSKVLDYQPVSLSEMPLKYLDSPNGRIWYMLKTFTIKQFDILRREWLDQLASGLSNGNAKDAGIGMLKLLRTVLPILAANATADEIKDWLLGREGTISDKVSSNLLKLFGISKYSTYKLKDGDVGGAGLSVVGIPHIGVAADMIKDTKDIYKALDEGDTSALDALNDAKSAARIPVVGKIYYWRHGGGVEKTKRQRARNWEENLPEGALDLLEERKELAKIKLGARNPAQTVRLAKLNQLESIISDRAEKVEGLEKGDKHTQEAYRNEIKGVLKKEDWGVKYRELQRERKLKKKAEFIEARDSIK